MNENKSEKIIDVWKTQNQFKQEIQVYSKEDAADIVAEGLKRLYPNADTKRNVIILVESDKNVYIDLIHKRTKDFYSMSGRGMVAYSFDTFTKQLTFNNYNVAFIIRNGFGYSPAIDVAMTKATFWLKLTVNEKIAIPILGLVENMAYFTPPELPENKYYIFGKEGARLLAQELDVELLVQVPISQSISQTNDSGNPISLDLSSCEAKTFMALAEIVSRKV
jgi:hypothetical protein